MANETYTIDFDANTQPIEAKLAALADHASAFSSAITRAFRDAIVGGKSFESVLSTLILRLSTIALNRALAPLGNLIGNLFGSFGLPATGAASTVTAAPLALNERLAPISAPHGVANAAKTPVAPTVVNFAITTANADSFRKSEAQVTAMLARAVGRGRRGL